MELNDLARRLDEQPAIGELHKGMAPAPASSGSVLTPDGRRNLEAINRLPQDESEVFDRVPIQGMSQTQAAQVLGASGMTVNRRRNRARQLLPGSPGDLDPGEEDPAAS
jgi:RNA polymerase sigma-70 factor (ECF subfamily)